MKRIVILLGLMLAMISIQAQNRRYMSSFQLFPSYYNPAMAGFSGNTISANYRSSRWSEFEGSPKTYFMSGDFKIKKHGLGFTFLHDSFGPYRETEALIHYGFLINLSRTLQLRTGAAATFNAQRFDMSALTMNAQNDPAFQNFAENFNKNMAVDFNIGVALSGANFHLGYALQNASQGALVGKGDFFNRLGYFHHAAQLGFRKALSNRLGFVVSGLYRYDPTFLYSAEGQIKTVLHDKVWIGFGYRSSMNTTGLIGFKAKQIQVGFAYELPLKNSSSANSGTSEFNVSYKFKTPKNKLPKHAKKANTKTLTIW